MQARPSDWHWLDTTSPVSAHELGAYCRLRREELDELVDYGALERLESDGSPSRFSGAWLEPLRVASQLRADFDLDLFTTGLLLGYLRRIDLLEKEVRDLRAHLPKHATSIHHEPERWHEEHGRANG